MKPLRWIGAFFAGVAGFAIWPERMTATECVLMLVGMASGLVGSFWLLAVFSN